MAFWETLPSSCENKCQFALYKRELVGKRRNLSYSLKRCDEAIYPLLYPVFSYIDLSYIGTPAVYVSKFVHISKFDTKQVYHHPNGRRYRSYLATCHPTHFTKYEDG
ncbi:unnamed protein product, partial [Choristocarpus tenellus]